MVYYPSTGRSSAGQAGKEHGNVFSNNSYLYEQNQHAIHNMYDNPSTPPAPACDHWTRHPWQQYDSYHSQSTQLWQGYSSGHWLQAAPKLESQIKQLRQQRKNFEIDQQEPAAHEL